MTDSEEQCSYSGCEADPDVDRTMILTGEEKKFCGEHDPAKDTALQDLWE